MLPIPLISKSSVLFTPSYHLESSNDNYLLNLVNNQSLIFEQTNTLEEPNYINTIIDSVTRRTLSLRTLTSNSSNANLQILDPNVNWVNGKGFTIIRLKNSTAFSVSPKRTPNPDFSIITNQTSLGDIKAILIEPPHDNSLNPGNGLTIQYSWIDRFGNPVSKMQFMGTCISGSLPSKVYLDIIKIIPNLNDFNFEPTVEWTRETVLSTGNVICSGLPLTGTLYGLGSPTPQYFSPARVFRNPDNSTLTQINELECFVFNDVISQNQIDDIVSYLKNKWSF